MEVFVSALSDVIGTAKHTYLNLYLARVLVVEFGRYDGPVGYTSSSWCQLHNPVKLISDK